MAKDTRVSNQEIADLVGLDMSTVSRLRSGFRLPNIDTMTRIEKALSWPLTEQAAVRETGAQKYATQFESHVERFWRDRDDSDEPE
jgi:transcriptional regulator with XRE-family HTH domain